MTNNEDNDSKALVKAKKSGVVKGRSTLAERGLGDLIRVDGQAVSQATGRRIVTILYAAFDETMDKLLHRCATEALAGSCDVVPVFEFNERKIRLLWEERQFDSAVLVLNNIKVEEAGDWPERLAGVMALIRWLHDHGPAIIIAFSGVPGLEEEARRSGADGFFDLPFPVPDFKKFVFEKLLQDR